MDLKDTEFVHLCEAVLSAADDFRNSVQGSPILLDYTAQIVAAISELRTKALDHRLPASGGTGWGMVRFVGEWADDHPLYDACLALERFYRAQF